jgi:hypothetical protein
MGYCVAVWTQDGQILRTIRPSNAYRDDVMNHQKLPLGGLPSAVHALLFSSPFPLARISFCSATLLRFLEPRTFRLWRSASSRMSLASTSLFGSSLRKVAPQRRPLRAFYVSETVGTQSARSQRQKADWDKGGTIGPMGPVQPVEVFVFVSELEAPSGSEPENGGFADARRCLGRSEGIDQISCFRPEVSRSHSHEEQEKHDGHEASGTGQGQNRDTRRRYRRAFGVQGSGAARGVK